MLIPRPKHGIDPEHDKHRKEELCQEQELEKHLEDLRKKHSARQMNYIYGKDMMSYLIEVPEGLFSQKQVPSELIFCNKRVGFQRYTTDFINSVKEGLIDSKNKANARIASHSKKLMGLLLKSKTKWLDFIAILMELDCLISLADVSFKSGSLQMCRPLIESRGPGQQSFLHLEQSRHFTLALANPNFVANDVVLGNGSTVSLLTGSNMAGKSTLMKQVCIAVIMG